MDGIASQADDCSDEPSSVSVRRWTESVKRLHVARHIAQAPAIGLGVAFGVLTVVSVAMALAKGDLGPLAAIPHVMTAVLGFGLLGWFGGRHFENMLADAAADDPRPWKAAALLEAAAGLPMAHCRSRFERNVAAHLAAITSEWWEAHASMMREPVSQVLAAYSVPGKLRPADGALLPALFDAIARCERTEFIKAVAQYERTPEAHWFPGEVARAARRCGDALRARAKRDREAATLLRPADAPVDTLLSRPSPARLRMTSCWCALLENRLKTNPRLRMPPTDRRMRNCESAEGNMRA